jgi:hypothetical protein
LLLQQPTEAVPAIDAVTLEHEAAIETLDRLVKAAKLLQRERKIEEIVSYRLVLPDRLREPFDRKLWPLGEHGQHPHQVQGVSVFAIERKRVLAALFGVQQLPGLEQAKTSFEIPSRRVRARHGRSLRSLCEGSSLLAVHRHVVDVAI